MAHFDQWFQNFGDFLHSKLFDYQSDPKGKWFLNRMNFGPLVMSGFQVVRGRKDHQNVFGVDMRKPKKHQNTWFPCKVFQNDISVSVDKTSWGFPNVNWRLAGPASPWLAWSDPTGWTWNTWGPKIWTVQDVQHKLGAHHLETNKNEPWKTVETACYRCWFVDPLLDDYPLVNKHGYWK